MKRARSRLRELLSRLREQVPGQRLLDRVAGRSAALPTPDVVDWADQGVTQLSRAVSELRRELGQEQLDQAVEGLVVVAATVEELARRTTGRR
ncbi:hypothetical protein AB0B15_03095 [Streptomyces sp. NPDC045456]|uniref:hypothetical protein n=1 Tax=Streptomyces sp. NPDC045456 TaxID=3155254 RepID=UPI0033EE2940